MRTNGIDEYRIKRGKIVKRHARIGGSGIPAPIVVIKDETYDRGNVHVNSVNDVYNHGINSLNCPNVNVRSLVNN